MKANRILSTLLLISVLTIPAGVFAANADREEKPRFKGVELYSWKTGEGNWLFVLLEGTNRLKTMANIKNAQDKLEGVEALEDAFAKLAEGEQVDWSHRVEGFHYPAPKTRAEIARAAKKAKIDLHLPGQDNAVELFLAAQNDAVDLPELDGRSGTGLKLECRVADAKFAIGNPVNIWCTVTNTTGGVKPIGWHSNVGLHFCCVQDDKATREGVLPRAFPQLRSPIMIKSKDSQPGYILYLPPRKSIEILLTYKAEQEEKFKGRIVYDPLAPRGGTAVVAKNGPPWKAEWVSSNEFEYEVIEDAKK